MPKPSLPTLDEAIERLYRLKVGVVGVGTARHERPHKPALLLAAFDLIAEARQKPAESRGHRHCAICFPSNAKWFEGMTTRKHLISHSTI